MQDIEMSNAGIIRCIDRRLAYVEKLGASRARLWR
jgi:hypothetical protein